MPLQLFNKLLFFCFLNEFKTFFITVMVIGFTQRMRTVSESDAPEEEDFFTIDIDVATLRPAEREHPMVFRVQYGGTAIVESENDQSNPHLDAVFGTRDYPHGHILQRFTLQHLAATIPSLTIKIRDDFRSEDEECFKILVYPPDSHGRYALFNCNDYEDGATNYFCETTICIEDDDGRFTN